MSNTPDSLRALPVDGQQLSTDEHNTFNSIYPSENQHTQGKRDNKKLNPIASELMDTGIAGLLFVIFSIPSADKLIEKMTGEGTSTLVKILIKATAFMILLYIIKNLSYMKQKKD